MTKSNRFRRIMAGLMIACTLVMGGCSAQPENGSAPQAQAAQPTDAPKILEKDTRSAQYFDTAVVITLYDAPEGLMDDMMAACAFYENLLSRTVVGSDVDRINKANGQTVTVHPETWAILARAKEISRETGGAFSITIAPISTMWDFTGGTMRMPTDEERIAALLLVNDELIVLGDNYTVTMPAGMMIDLGGIAKGYIADSLAAMARGKVSGGILNFGGNVYLIGRKPDGSEFRTGIADPTKASSYVAIVTLTDKSVVTSGTYERYFIRDGIRYHHILNPKTGLPAETDLAGATIILESSMDADAYATACIVFGREKALIFLNEHNLDGMLIDNDNNIWVTADLADQYPVTLVESGK